MTKEHRLMNEIALECGKRNWIYIRQNSGIFYTQYGEKIKIGFPGLSDILILTDKGQTIFVEAKIKPNRPTKEQLHFIEELKQRGFLAFVAYTLEEFIENVEKEN